MPTLALLSPEERFDFLRQIYMRAFDPVMDEVLAPHFLPEDKDTQAEDIAQFVLFSLSIKAAEYHGDELRLPLLMKRLRRLLRRVEKDVPGLFMLFIEAHRAAAAQRPN